MTAEATMISWPEARVALCHDWLTGMRGGERVLEILCEAYPSAPLYTLLANLDKISRPIRDRTVHTSWLQSIPGITSNYRMFLPVFPAAIAGLHPAPADVLVSTSHCVAKSIRTAPATRHICYCFTPMRYAWLFHEDYFPHPLKRTLLRPVLAALRRWDRNTAGRVDRFVAISEHVRARIQTFYGREADVVYPPADTEFFHPDPAVAREEFDFIISALVPYKKVDLAVRAYTRTGFPLKIMGSGSGLDALKRVAGPNITFLGRQPDEALRDHYRRCRFLIFPGEEDYGIVPVEAMACGTPVIAYGKGGATETVAENLSGVFFPEQTENSLIAAVDTAAARDWDPQAVRKQAEQFDVPNFLRGMFEIIEKVASGNPQT